MVDLGATGGGPFGAGDLLSRLFWLLPGLGRMMFPPLPPPGVPRLLLPLLPPPAAAAAGDSVG